MCSPGTVPSTSPRPVPRPRHSVVSRLPRLLLGLACALPASFAAPPVTSGLVLHLEADAGVGRDPTGTVTHWQDQSPAGNDVFAEGDPELLAAATPSGRPAVRLDTTGDKLERIHASTPLQGLPAGNADRTMFLVANYTSSTWWSGVAFGRGDHNRAYGLTVKHDTGELVAQGWGRGNDLVSSTRGLGAGWLLQGGLVDGGASTLFKDGTVIARFQHTYATAGDKLVLGEEIKGLGHVGVEIAAVLVYQRALGVAERQSVEQYLRGKYLVAGATNAAPAVTITAPADGSASVTGASVQLAGAAQDPEDGTLSANLAWRSDRDGELGRGAALGPATLSVGRHVISATVTDSRGATGSASITHTVADDAPPTEEPPPAGEVVFFDGARLQGVHPWSAQYGRSDPEGLFTVQNGLLRVGGDEPYAALMTEQEFDNYVLRLEYTWGSATYGTRTGKARDAGVLLHSRGPDGGWRGRLMAAIEVQVMEGSTGDLILLTDTESPPGTAPMRMTARVQRVSCVNRTWNCRGGYRWHPDGSTRTYSSLADTVHWSKWDRAWRDVAGFRGRDDIEKLPGEWNELIILCDNDRIEVYLNGVKINEATAVFPTSGKIQLQAEQAEYFVRRWELRRLD